jgi:hypothetical protein
MCSAQSKDLLMSEDASDWMRAEVDRLHAGLSSCLHAIGQPLTVLRGTIAASTVPSIPAEKQQKYLATSAEQVGLLCCLFDCLRDIVDSSQFIQECSPVEVSQFLSLVIEDQMPSLQASGLAVDVSMPAELHSTMLADMNRALKAVTSTLKIAASVSLSGDVIEVKVAPRKSGVELVIQRERSHSRSLTSLERMYLAVAEANICGQNGEYTFAEDPFCVCLTLPIHSQSHNRVLDIAKVMGKKARQGALAAQIYS